MRAIEIEGGTGPAEALRVIETADPTPGPGQILIEVAAAGVNRPDLLQRAGLYPPPPGASPIPGLEVAGTVRSLGPDVRRWKVGDRVCALLGGGGYAELAAVDERHALPVPDGVELSAAAALPETVITVWANVFEAGVLNPGETLLVHGATSGIGVTAIQMAKAHGARVIATSRGAAKAAAALSVGADVSLDASSVDLASAIKDAGGADVILDMVGAAYADINQAVLKAFGRWVVIGTQSGSTAQVDLARLMLKRQVLTGSTLRARPPEEKARLVAEVERVVWPWVARGSVRPPVDAVFPLAEARDAHLRMEAGVHVGKIILTV